MPRARRHPRYPYRMRDLCRLTGLSRQTIHYYHKQGLLPEPHKTGRNMAFYGEEHVERIHFIQKLQHERFLPLRAIKAILHDEESGYDAAQRDMLTEIKARLSPDVVGEPAVLDAAKLAERHNVPLSDVRRMAELGLFALKDADSDEPKIAGQDAWAVVHWGQVRALGIQERLELTVDDMLIYSDAVSELFEREKAMVLSRMTRLGASEAAEVIEKAMPLVNAFLAQYHATLVRRFFLAME